MFGNLKQFPKPIAKYFVGITEMDFIDSNRIGVYEIQKNAPREIPVTIYYPADSNEGKQSSPYVIDEIAENYSKSTMGLVSKKSIKNVETHCYKDVKISSKEDLYPVVFFNHGYMSYPAQNTVLCSDLASAGYIVVSVGHPYEAMAVKFQDGRVVKAHDYFNKKFKAMMTPESKKVLKDAKNNVYTDAEVLPIITEYLNQAIKPTHIWTNIKVWADDNRFIADQLEKINDGIIPSILKGKLKLEIGFGITGHSYGGCTATQVCLDDARFKCGISLDAPTYSDYWDKDIQKPYLTLGGYFADFGGRSTFLLNSEDSYFIIIPNTEHSDFTDAIFLMRQLKLLGIIGKRDMNFMRDIITDYHEKFFNKYLKGTNIDLPASKYENVKFRSRLKGTTDK